MLMVVASVSWNAANVVVEVVVNMADIVRRSVEMFAVRIKSPGK